MLATEVQLHAEEPFAGLVVLSGALISEDRWRPAAVARAKNLHVVGSHGRRDPILPFQSGEDLAKLLTDNGAQVKFIPHNGAHEIPPAALQGLAELVSRRLQS